VDAAVGDTLRAIADAWNELTPEQRWDIDVITDDGRLADRLDALTEEDDDDS